MHIVKSMLEMEKVIVFVCVSNTCRSPMAEYMFRDIIQKNGRASEFTVKSRSLTDMYEPPNSPASENGVQVCSSIGIHRLQSSSCIYRYTDDVNYRC